jgi:hypothetical protein
MKMAKASKADIDAAIELCHFLDMIRGGCPAADAVEEFELKGYEDLVERGDACDDEFVLRAHERGGLFRIVWGMQVLLDPANEMVDPDLPHLAHHPKRVALEAEVERLRAAATRLSGAAAAVSP